jgi:hypothetical protein
MSVTTLWKIGESPSRQAVKQTCATTRFSAKASDALAASNAARTSPWSTIVIERALPLQTSLCRCFLTIGKGLDKVKAENTLKGKEER